MQIPQGIMYGLSLRLLEICLATMGVCVFCALTTVGALFIFLDQKGGRKEMKRICAIFLVICLCLGICGCSGGNAGQGEDIQQENIPQRVDITLENWDEYFEIVTSYTPDSVFVEFCLKEQYEERLDEDNFAGVEVEVVHKNIQLHKITLNLVNNEASVDPQLADPDSCGGYSNAYLGINFELGDDYTEQFRYRGYDHFFDEMVVAIDEAEENDDEYIYYAPIAESHEVVQISGTLVFE